MDESKTEFFANPRKVLARARGTSEAWLQCPLITSEGNILKSQIVFEGKIGPVHPRVAPGGC